MPFKTIALCSTGCITTNQRSDGWRHLSPRSLQYYQAVRGHEIWADYNKTYLHNLVGTWHLMAVPPCPTFNYRYMLGLVIGSSVTVQMGNASSRYNACMGIRDLWNCCFWLIKYKWRPMKNIQKNSANDPLTKLNDCIVALQSYSNNASTI